MTGRTPIEAERLARICCRKGDHRQAADLFLEAGESYESLELWGKASECYAGWERELAWVWPAVPVNIPGLAD